MGVTKQLVSAGNGVDFPKPGDFVTIHYTGKLTNGSK
jgi:peptidylprolyl isomerase/FK506-binding protein 1